MNVCASEATENRICFLLIDGQTCGLEQPRQSGTTSGEGFTHQKIRTSPCEDIPFVCVHVQFASQPMGFEAVPLKRTVVVQYNAT